MQHLLKNIRIVLVDTTHPGNIGSSARAMKVMGLERLYLLRPRHFPDDKATALASGAADVLDRAVLCDSLDAAIGDCKLVMGASARSRTLAWPEQTARAAAVTMLTELRSAGAGQSALPQAAVLFGTESAGLSNEQLQCCHYRIEIPANPEYSSLNLSQAVQVVCYELRMAALGDQLTVMAQDGDDEDLAPADQRSVESLLQRTETMLWALHYLHPTQPQMLLQRLRRLAMRARLQDREVSILQGIISTMMQRLDD